MCYGGGKAVVTRENGLAWVFSGAGDALTGRIQETVAADGSRR